MTGRLTPAQRFGAQVRALRKARGMSQVELGKRTLTSQATISRVETGDYDVVGWRLPDRLAAALGCSIDELLGESGFVPKLPPPPYRRQIWG